MAGLSCRFVLVLIIPSLVLCRPDPVARNSPDSSSNEDPVETDRPNIKGDVKIEEELKLNSVLGEGLKKILGSGRKGEFEKGEELKLKLGSDRKGDLEKLEEFKLKLGSDRKGESEKGEEFKLKLGSDRKGDLEKLEEFKLKLGSDRKGESEKGEEFKLKLGSDRKGEFEKGEELKLKLGSDRKGDLEKLEELKLKLGSGLREELKKILSSDGKPEGDSEQSPQEPMQPIDSDVGEIKHILSTRYGVFLTDADDRVYYRNVTGDGEFSRLVALDDWAGFKTLAAGEEGYIWGLRSDHTVARRVGSNDGHPLGQAWETVPGPEMAELGVGLGGVCGLDFHGYVHCLDGTFGLGRHGTGTWSMNVQNFPGARQIVVRRSHVYLVDATHGVHRSTVFSNQVLNFEALGRDWHGIKELTVSPNGHIYSIGTLDHAVYSRVGSALDSQEPFGSRWEEISPRRKLLRHLSAGAAGLWVVGQDNKVLYHRGTFGDVPGVAES